MTQNPNINCLIGFECPACGHFGPFTIAVNTYLTVSDDGGCDYEHAEWDDESSCFCQGCDHHAQVKDFTGEGA